MGFYAVPQRMKKAGAAGLSRLFRPSFLQRLVARTHWPVLDELEKNTGIQFGKLKGKRVSDFYRFSYDYLSNFEKSEYLLKNELINFFIRENNDLQRINILSEFAVGSARADLVFVKDTVSIYEIKSDLDGASRIHSQLLQYSAFGCEIYLAYSPTWDEHVSERISSNIGLVRVGAPGQVACLRRSAQFSEQNDPEKIFNALHREDYLGFLNRRFSIREQVPNGRIYKFYLDYFLRLNSREITLLKVSALRRRRGRGISLSDIVRLDSPLRAAGLQFLGSAASKEKIISALAGKL